MYTPNGKFLMIAMFGNQQLFWFDVNHFSIEFNANSQIETDMGNGAQQNDANVRRSQ
jgi:hypothetical protein